MPKLQRTPKVAKQVAKQNAGTEQLTEGNRSRPTGKPAVSTGSRKWERRCFRPWWTRGGERYEAEAYAIRLAHDGERQTVNLLTPDLREAARRAAKFAGILRVSGWDSAHADLSPEKAKVVARRESPTVGCLIAEAERCASHVKPTTLAGYAVALRWATAMVCGIEGTAARYDYKRGGLATWRETVEAVPLASMTAAKVKAAYAAWRKAREADESALRSGASLVRQARSFWSKGMGEAIDLQRFPNPFAGLSLKQKKSPRYQPTFDGAELVASARKELRDTDPQSWLALLLLLGAGLRRGEADALVWSNVEEGRGVLRVTSGKTTDSIGEVPLAPEMVEELARLRKEATGLHVLEGDDRPRNPKQRIYRAEATFARLAAWLRRNGVTDRKPLHCLRREAGSLVNAIAGIHAASRFLRHGDIGVTSSHYLDGRQKVVVPLFETKATAEGAK